MLHKSASRLASKNVLHMTGRRNEQPTFHCVHPRVRNMKQGVPACVPNWYSKGHFFKQVRRVYGMTVDVSDEHEVVLLTPLGQRHDVESSINSSKLQLQPCITVKVSHRATATMFQGKL